MIGFFECIVGCCGVKVVKPFSLSFGIGELKGSLRESWRKSLHNLHGGGAGGRGASL
jgi:hypothetical protein